MPPDIDSALIDRVFQPASDRLAAQRSCFGLARLCLAGAVLFQFVVLASDLQATADPSRRLLSGGITILALLGAGQARHVIVRAERQSRPGLLNVRRITLRWQRVAWTVISAWVLAAAFGRPSGANLAVCLASLCWLGCIYFTSCTPSHPVLRRNGMAPAPNR